MNSGNQKIGIAGLGGVGGFIGAPLVKTYKEKEDVQVIFICRGETKERIRQKGLTFESNGVIETVFPGMASDDPAEIGTLDVLLIACKSYSLASLLEEYKGCIGENTVIIPLQNMVNAKEVIQQTLPGRGKVLEGCIYVVSNVKEKGYILHAGGPGKIFIGGEKQEEYAWLVELLRKGGLDITYEEEIKKVLWKKFLFLSPVASVTSAFQVTFGQLLENEELMKTLDGLMREVQLLAQAKNISLSNDDITNLKTLLTQFPYESKSSLQLDFEKHNRTEKAFLVDYVIETGKQYGMDTPYYERINDQLKHG
ncbi:2-dehydropantoate 2-reductase [Rapidithrix thailandica]|uniref:2-dehydropantoate 2-reductase n=1 Tax=Rapidithrix thailandica TaxID=413964 RepID=A0AAW9SJG6_9BACT